MRQRGFTLLELLIVVAMVVIASAIAAPSMRNMLLRGEVVSVTNNFASALMTARNSAIERRIRIGVYAAGGDWNQGWCVRIVDGTEDCDASPNVLAVFDAPSDNGTVTASVTSFIYQANGTRTGGGAVAPVVEVDICTEPCRRVTVLASGAFSIAEVTP